MSGLGELGLSRYEEACYVALVRSGRCDARKVSAVSGVPPTATYPNLHSLVKKGLIQKLDGDISLFEALEPGIALRALAEEKRRLAARSADEAILALKSLSREAPLGSEPISMSLGREMSHQLFADFAKNTNKEIFIIGWKFASSDNKFAILKRLQALCREKKDVRLITNDPKHSKNRVLAQIKKMGVAMRFYPADNFSIVVRDGEEAKITLKNPNLEKKINLHIEDRDLAAALRDYFLTLWKKSAPA